MTEFIAAFEVVLSHDLVSRIFKSFDFVRCVTGYHKCHKNAENKTQVAQIKPKRESRELVFLFINVTKPFSGKQIAEEVDMND